MKHQQSEESLSTLESQTMTVPLTCPSSTKCEQDTSFNDLVSSIEVLLQDLESNLPAIVSHNSNPTATNIKLDDKNGDDTIFSVTDDLFVESKDDHDTPIKPYSSNTMNEMLNCSSSSIGSFDHNDSCTSKLGKRRQQLMMCPPNESLNASFKVHLGTFTSAFSPRVGLRKEPTSTMTNKGSSPVVGDDEKRWRSSTTSSFPQTLYNLLENATDGGYGDCISWQSHGRAFRVHDPLRFVGLVMPRYFQQTRFTSFQRQLALYGFIRITRKGKDRGAYYHELFVRGYPQLCQLMHRTPVKGALAKSFAARKTEPDFYQMPPIGPSDLESIVPSSRLVELMSLGLINSDSMLQGKTVQQHLVGGNDPFTKMSMLSCLLNSNKTTIPKSILTPPSPNLNMFDQITLANVNNNYHNIHPTGSTAENLPCVTQHFN